MISANHQISRGQSEPSSRPASPSTIPMLTGLCAFAEADLERLKEIVDRHRPVLDMRNPTPLEFSLRRGTLSAAVE